MTRIDRRCVALSQQAVPRSNHGGGIKARRPDVPPFLTSGLFLPFVKEFQSIAFATSSLIFDVLRRKVVIEAWKKVTSVLNKIRAVPEALSVSANTFFRMKAYTAVAKRLAT